MGKNRQYKILTEKRDYKKYMVWTKFSQFILIHTLEWPKLANKNIEWQLNFNFT